MKNGSESAFDFMRQIHYFSLTSQDRLGKKKFEMQQLCRKGVLLENGSVAFSGIMGEVINAYQRGIVRLRKQKLDDKVTDIEQDNVNLCFVGTYSSGKSVSQNTICKMSNLL